MGRGVRLVASSAVEPELTACAPPDVGVARGKRVRWGVRERPRPPRCASLSCGGAAGGSAGPEAPCSARVGAAASPESGLRDSTVRGVASVAAPREEPACASEFRSCAGDPGGRPGAPCACTASTSIGRAPLASCGGLGCARAVVGPGAPLRSPRALAPASAASASLARAASAGGPTAIAHCPSRARAAALFALAPGKVVPTGRPGRPSRHAEKGLCRAEISRTPPSRWTARRSVGLSAAAACTAQAKQVRFHCQARGAEALRAVPSTCSRSQAARCGVASVGPLQWRTTQVAASCANGCR